MAEIKVEPAYVGFYAYRDGDEENFAWGMTPETAKANLVERETER